MRLSWTRRALATVGLLCVGLVLAAVALAAGSKTVGPGETVKLHDDVIGAHAFGFEGAETKVLSARCEASRCRATATASVSAFPPPVHGSYRLEVEAIVHPGAHDDRAVYPRSAHVGPVTFARGTLIRAAAEGGQTTNKSAIPVDLSLTLVVHGAARFELTSVDWADQLTYNSSANIDLHWKGEPVFPVTATYTPEPGCTSGNFTCVPGSYTFSTKANPLVWPDGDFCSGDSDSPSHTGSWRFQLKDATGERTNTIVKTLTCNP